MRYRWFCPRGLFTGSGVAGAGCKSIARRRLRQAGMHRTTDGAVSPVGIRLRVAELWDFCVGDAADADTGAQTLRIAVVVVVRLLAGRPSGSGRAQTTRVTRSVAISSGSVTESNETTLTWLLPNLSWAWFFLAPSW